jgi:hypothetical protein
MLLVHLVAVIEAQNISRGEGGERERERERAREWDLETAEEEKSKRQAGPYGQRQGHLGEGLADADNGLKLAHRDGHHVSRLSLAGRLAH